MYLGRNIETIQEDSHSSQLLTRFYFSPKVRGHRLEASIDTQHISHRVLAQMSLFWTERLIEHDNAGFRI